MIHELKDINAIIALWRAAFHDSEEEIRFFTENVRDAVCLAYYAEDKAVSMLYLVDCKVNGKDGGYVYAACTDKAYQRRGIMAELLDYCQGLKPFICLIPADEHLVKYYQKLGFTTIHKIDEIAFSQSNDILEYLFDGCRLATPILLSTEEK